VSSLTSETSRENAWIAYSTPNPRAAARLFCFPYAGGSAATYRPWNGAPFEAVEICPIQTPGREKRIAERPFTHLRTLSKAVADVIPLDKPFAFFGHSVGALLGFEVARELRRQRAAVPFHLFVSGCTAPHLCPNRPPRFNQTREQLLAEIRKLGGTPEDVLKDSGLLDLVLPAIRADFSLFDTYDYHDEKPFDFAVTALSGDADPEVDCFETLQWHIQTDNKFRHYQFPGNHFFLLDSSSDVRVLIAKEIDSTAPIGLASADKYLGETLS
jgi:medium-chain acyl-[acyl-carrier-protein] hydrolase